MIGPLPISPFPANPECPFHLYDVDLLIHLGRSTCVSCIVYMGSEHFKDKKTTSFLLSCREESLQRSQIFLKLRGVQAELGFCPVQLSSSLFPFRFCPECIIQEEPWVPSFWLTLSASHRFLAGIEPGNKIHLIGSQAVEGQ